MQGGCEKPPTMIPPSPKLAKLSPLASGGLRGVPKPRRGVYTERGSIAQNSAPPRTAYETQAPTLANEVPSDLTSPWYPPSRHGASVLGAPEETCAAAPIGSSPRLANTTATRGATNLGDMGPSSHAKPTPTSAATIPPSGNGRFDRSLVLLQ